ncbi:helix-turn-helix transcriptional regulator [Methylophilus sp. 5]|uniref:helix-turn-helix domain-containing protein n=1 Tax=Methylophilus sp. 5 TaxID=1112274 RepID=UPI000688C326|nr:helix-turn-helix transcriptional regulator [Methylophilus sp. 5]
MPKSTPQLLALQLAEQANLLNISQTEIATATGINQSQISRIFDGKVKRHSKALEKISAFLNIRPNAVPIDIVKSNKELMEALSVTWDGSSAHSVALANIIRTLRALRY